MNKQFNELEIYEHFLYQGIEYVRIVSNNTNHIINATTGEIVKALPLDTVVTVVK